MSPLELGGTSSGQGPDGFGEVRAGTERKGVGRMLKCARVSRLISRRHGRGPPSGSDAYKQTKLFANPRGNYQAGNRCRIFSYMTPPVGAVTMDRERMK